MIKILIIDDQALIRDGLKTVLDLEDDLEVLGVGANGLEAIQLNETLNPDIVLLDIRMPELNGVDAAEKIRENDEEVKILILTTFDDEDYIIEALANGADGYLLKDIETDKLIESIRECVQGDFMLPASVAKKLARRLRSSSTSKKISEAKTDYEGEVFSDRELQIGKCILEGMSNKEIANTLFITEGTVKNYISSLYRKLEVNSRAKAIRKLEQII